MMKIAWRLEQVEVVDLVDARRGSFAGAAEWVVMEASGRDVRGGSLIVVPAAITIVTGPL